MKVSKNQIQNVSFSQKEDKEVKQAPKGQEPTQGSEEKIAKSLECLANQVPIVKKDSLTQQKAELEERLKMLNTLTALHRFEGDDERFGEEGIKSILNAIDTVDKVKIVNEQLNILGDAANPERDNIWAVTILELIDPEFAEEMKKEREQITEELMNKEPRPF